MRAETRRESGESGSESRDKREKTNKILNTHVYAQLEQLH